MSLMGLPCGSRPLGRYLVFEMEHFEQAGPSIPLLGHCADLGEARAACRRPLAQFSYSILDTQTGAVHSLESDGEWSVS
jgi:hypothetical protein